ncbi:MAG: N-methyl-D-aspartate receptor NMDAR2C subunit [Ramlibacter sp.]
MIGDAAAWRAIWRDLGAYPPDGLHAQLLASWSESHRHYHAPQHLRECLERFESVRGLAKHPGEVALALWFHDAFYDPRRQDNEHRSAEWARAAALQAGVPEESAARIHALVMATCHQTVPDDADGQLLVDVDLSILGAEPARFDESDAQIREEYAHVPHAQFVERRRGILGGFLARPSIYSTEHFHALLEQRARANLQRAVARLSA